MLDYLRNLTKSDEEKRQEALNAYLDDTLAPKQKQQVEEDLARDESLRAELGQMRLLQQEMRQLPQRRVRRNFTLDPALYGRPRREPLVQAYPVLRTATALAAFLFIFALTANLFLNGSPGVMSGAESEMMLMESSEAIVAEAVEEAAVEEAEAADTIPMESEILEEMEEESIVSDEIMVDPKSEIPAAEPEIALAPLELESDSAAAPMQSAPAQEEPQAASPAEDGQQFVAPTMESEGTARSNLAQEQEALPTTPAIEPSMQTSPRAVGDGVGAADASADIGEIGTSGDDGVYRPNSLGLIVLVLGIVFVILISLTLLARRRL